MENISYRIELSMNDAEGWSNIGEDSDETKVREIMKDKINYYTTRFINSKPRYIRSIRVRLIKVSSISIEEHFIH